MGITETKLTDTDMLWPSSATCDKKKGDISTE